MAWRIDEHVIRGEIDNRTRGQVTGRIWFAGRAEPVELHLAGNAWRDLAGRRLEFVNPEPKPGLAASFAPRQHGSVGDITASRKVRVPEIPLDQIGEYYAARKPFPWHWGNSLYLEWFSVANGRVVIESAAYQLTVGPDPAWEMTPAEEEEQHRANGAAMTGFMEQLGEAVAAADAHSDEDTRPLSEDEAEKMQEQSDRLVDRIMARMEREGDEADYERILEEEVERARRERGEPEPTPEEAAESERWIEEMNAAAEEALAEMEADQWKRADGDDFDEADDDKHPLAAHAFEFSLKILHDVEERNWVAADAPRDHPVTYLVESLSKAGAKLAGSLDGRDEWPPPREFCAQIIVRLKRAAVYFEDARQAAESCREENLADPAWLADVLQETAALAAETDGVIVFLRQRLNGDQA